MAKKQVKNLRAKRPNQEPLLPFTIANYVLLAISLLVIVVGYAALGHGEWDSSASRNIAPILLVFGYCVMIPIAILYKKKESNAAQE